MKPILFNTEMVRAIQDGRKTMTRRLIKPQPKSPVVNYLGTWQETQPCANGIRVFPPPYKPGDILYVRETWSHPSSTEIANGADPQKYLYAADELQPCAWDKWRPSIHMPKEAARIFLRVKSVRVQQLRDMVLADVLMEGIKEGSSYEETWDKWHKTWDSTVPKHPNKFKSYPYYWKDNPWVWVISFERCEKPEEVSGC